MTLAPDPRHHLKRQQAHSRFSFGTLEKTSRFCSGYFCAGLALLAIATLLALPTAPLFAQASPSIATVDPSSGKVGETVTVTGAKLGKSSVSAVFLSDDKSDYKAVVVEQSDTKIVIKVPQVKQGDYNLSFQEGTAIYILPVRFNVQE
jgi:hypothetical protein